MPHHETDDLIITDPEDAFRSIPDDPEYLASTLDQIADQLDWALLTAGGVEFMRLYQAAKRIGEIADQSMVIAQLD